MNDNERVAKAIYDAIGLDVSERRASVMDVCRDAAHAAFGEVEKLQAEKDSEFARWR